jgi:hypothetical protein
MGDLASLFQDAVSKEVEQQKAVDWKRLLASSIAQGLANSSAQLQQLKPNDYGSNIGAALLQGAAGGFTNLRDKAISEDVSSKFLSGINDYETGRAASLAKALQGLGLENAASQVSSYDTARALDRKQSIADAEQDNKLKLDYFQAETPFWLERQNALAQNRLAQALAVASVKKGTATESPSLGSSDQLQAYRQSILSDPTKDYTAKQMALAKTIKEEMKGVSANAAMLQAGQMLRESSLRENPEGEDILEIERKVPPKLLTKALEQKGHLQALELAKSQILDVYDKIKKYDTLELNNPFSDAYADIESAKSAIWSSLTESHKGAMSEPDAKRIMALIPRSWQSDSQVDKIKSNMLDKLESAIGNKTGILTEYGVIKKPTLTSKTKVKSDIEKTGSSKPNPGDFESGQEYLAAVRAWEASQ